MNLLSRTPGFRYYETTRWQDEMPAYFVELYDHTVQEGSMKLLYTAWNDEEIFEAVTINVNFVVE
jgi:hypothetical protein